jgi:hypothetical protein
MIKITAKKIVDRRNETQRKLELKIEEKIQDEISKIAEKNASD